MRTLLTIDIRFSGFSTKSYAPSRIALTAASTDPYAVINTTSTSGATCFVARSSSSPVVPGIIKSVSRTCTRWVRTSSRARLASGADSVRMPSRWNIFSSDSTFDRSSSTMSTVMASGEGSATGPSAGNTVAAGAASATSSLETSGDADAG